MNEQSNSAAQWLKDNLGAGVYIIDDVGEVWRRPTRCNLDGSTYTSSIDNLMPMRCNLPVHIEYKTETPIEVAP